ncbi:Hypothetical protein CINCED_3A017492 [Cinara cedri]|uniref:Uncharacterized protein n=1 Tax=Cinara cedri TaxID=506608 RepID=A0A5E4N583_9HEMI|nr:Hypothetical protein CINCED_3A017492 [Cinara cedri]
MTPINHILQNIGTQIDCNEFISAAFASDAKRWTALTPKSHKINPPQKLKPATTLSWSYENADNFMTAGIHTPEIINALQKHLMYPHETKTDQEKPIGHIIGHEVINQGFDTRNIIHSELQKIWG